MNSAQCYVADWMGQEFVDNGNMYIYGWIPSLFTWHYHNTVNQLYPNAKQKVQKKKKAMIQLKINKIRAL